MRLNEFPIIQTRYVQLLRFTQFIHSVFLLVLLYQAFSSESLQQVFNGGVLSNIVMIMVLECLIFHLKKGRSALVVSIHQLISVSFMMTQALLYGGFATPNTVAFHLPLLVVSIYTQQAVYKLFFAIILLMVIAIGLNEIFGWLVFTDVDAIGKPDVVISLLLIYAYTGILSWLLIYDLRFAYHKKEKERERIQIAKDQIQVLANTDQLTGLLNRYGIHNKFDALIKETNFNESSVLLLFIDIDDFKLVNNQYGHLVGDHILMCIGKRLRNIMNADVTISRLGGDEFVLVFEQANQLQIDPCSNSVINEIAQPFNIEGVKVEITSSVGIVMMDHSEQTFDEVYRKADMAMYQAKKVGKNHYYCYHDDLEQTYMANLELLQSIQVAKKKGHLNLHYQPKLHTLSNQIMGAEALLRWDTENPQGYTAHQIIPIIETTNLIHEIGYWVIRQACEDCKAWNNVGTEVPVSVNISSRQFTDCEFSMNVQRILEEVQLPASLLMLEIAEHVLTEQGKGVMKQLQQLKAYGVKISIDCFGVGHSNLAVLADLSVDELKMDRGFTMKLTSSYKARSIVTAFVKMSHQLNMNLVALGVESEEHHCVLQSLGCMFGQGFLWKKAVPAEELTQLIQS